MTMVPEFRKCPKCKRMYSWNPDVGKMFCPQCGMLGQFGGGNFPRKKNLDILLKKK